MRALTSFAIAVALFVISEGILAFYGIVKIYLVFFIPVFVSSSFWSFLPLLFFLIPFAAVLFSTRDGGNIDSGKFRHEYVPDENQKRGTSVAGIVMIGPFPIIFGKNVDRKILIILILLVLILIASWLLLSK